MSAAGKGEKGERGGSISPLPYEVDMTAVAEAVYADLFRKCKAAEKSGSFESAHSKTFRIVEEAIKTIIPHDPINKRYALQGRLSNIYRLRKGRMRIMWIASSSLRRICILFISDTPRKEGDANDPYELVEGLVESGHFDEAMKKTGVRRPSGKRR